MSRLLLSGRALAASAVLAGVCLLGGALGSAQAKKAHPVTVMSYNIFGQGSELSHTRSTTSFSQLATNVAADYNNVIASNIPARSKALAAEIKANGPDLVGLQEASLYRTAPSDPAHPFTIPGTATTVSYDSVQLLVKALAHIGMRYRAVAITNNFDLQFTGDFGAAGKKDIRLTDRVAILARKGVKVSNVQEQNYTAHDAVPVLGVPITIKDGWASVDAKVGGKQFRFITSHLDGLNNTTTTPTSDSVRASETQEIINGPANTTMPVVFTCDCNTTPDQAAHQALTGAGLVDSWAKTHPHQAGLTCCHRDFPTDPEVTLTDPKPRQGITTRLDYAFARKLKVLADTIVGLNPADRTKTNPKLWPTDHLGLVAQLALP